MITKKCSECGKDFQVDETKRNWQSIILCSLECQHQRTNRKSREKYVKQKWPQKRICEWCNKVYWVYAYTQKANRKYCTRECYLDKKRDEAEKKYELQRIKKVCNHCGFAFLPKKYSGNRQEYCSKACYRKQKWVENGRHKRGYNELRNDVLEKYSETCQLCGKKKDRMEVHHLDSIRYDGDLNNDMSNMTLLCKKCHYAIHHVSVIVIDGGWKVTGKIFDIIGLSGNVKIQSTI